MIVINRFAIAIYSVRDKGGQLPLCNLNINGINGPDGPAASFQVELFDTQTPVTVANF